MTKEQVRWHLNGRGEPGRCRATKGRCPLGGEGHHYPTREAAQGAYEKQQHPEAFVKFQKNSRSVQSVQAIADSLELQNSVHREARSVPSHFHIAQRRKRVEEVVARLVEAGKTTDKLHATETVGGLVFTPERAREHDKLVEDLLESFKSVPREGRVIVAGGLGGAGKSTVLKEFAGIDRSRYATLNPDDVKEELAARGLVPKVRGLTPMEASPLVHEEASHITQRLMAALAAERRNIILDTTMASTPSVTRKVTYLKSRGYGQVSAVFVDIEPHTSLQRSNGRYAFGMEGWFRRENELGGRVLPEEVVTAQAPTKPGFKSKNAEVLVEAFESGLFTEPPRVFNNNRDGEAPVEVAYDDFRGDYSKLFEE